MKFTKDKSSVFARTAYYDDIVIGSGIAGLEIARLLQAVDRTVCIIERSEAMGAGATTHNEGWLHAGTYHSAAIVDRKDAIRVGRYCIEGFKRIIEKFPNSLTKTGSKSYALLRDGSREQDVVERWIEAGVEFEPVKLAAVADRNPQVCLSDVDFAFRVNDTAINTSTLLKMISQEIHWKNNQTKVDIILSAHITSVDPAKHEVTLMSGGEQQVLKAQNIVFAAGAGCKDLVDRFLGGPEIRLFRGHILITRNLSPDNFIVLDKGCPTWMNHGAYSLIGMTRMTEEVFDETYDVMTETVEQVRQKLQELLLFPPKIIDCYACLKPTVTNGMHQSLTPVIFEPEPGNFVILPGKMTEAPIVCEALLKKIMGYDKYQIARRPIDIIADSKMVESRAFS